MTESTVETQENEKPVFPDEMAEMSFNMLAGLIADRNNKVGKINAVKGDRLHLQQELEEKSDNPDAVAARAARDKAQEELDEAVMALHKAVQPEIESILADAEKSVSGIEEEIKEADGKIKPGVAYFKKVFGENLAKHLPALERLKGFSTKGAGSSGRRIRGYNVIVTIDNEDTEFENVASAAKYLDVDTATVQEAFFAAAGNPEKLADAPDRVEFKVEYTETDDDENVTTHTADLVAYREVKEDGAEVEADEDEDATESE